MAASAKSTANATLAYDFHSDTLAASPRYKSQTYDRQQHYYVDGAMVSFPKPFQPHRHILGANGVPAQPTIRNPTAS